MVLNSFNDASAIQAWLSDLQYTLSLTISCS
jgi:hypothetical protein